MSLFFIRCTQTCVCVCGVDDTYALDGCFESWRKWQFYVVLVYRCNCQLLILLHLTFSSWAAREDLFYIYACFCFFFLISFMILQWLKSIPIFCNYIFNKCLKTCHRRIHRDWYWNNNNIIIILSTLDIYASFADVDIFHYLCATVQCTRSI